jgi:predicted ATPase
MPSINSFKIENFKGAEQVKIELKGRVDCPVITLIGLNESGKTTILEAISHFVTDDKAVASIFDGIHTKASSTSLIPVHRKAAFSGKVRISAEIEISTIDKQKIKSIASDLKLELDLDSLPSTINVSRVYEFKDSKLEGEPSNFWNDLDFMVYPSNARSEKNRKFKKYVRPEGKGAEDLWLKSVKYLRELLPSIAYFPTFLVDMPSKIYLQAHKDEKPVNKYYRLVIQDILDSLDDKDKLTLERHVCARISDFHQQETSPNWLSIFWGSPSKTPIDSVFQKIANAITREVLGSWHKVFQLPISAKVVTLEWQVDTEKDNLPYITFFVSDGESRYSITERSLGFRWFFSFLLFTSFKKGKSNSTIFLFDEPAANLHAKAQTELLKSFSKIVDSSNKIVYSTHSHHMINPQWLSGAYIVENTAIDYDSEDDIVGLGVKPTNIKATTYREFVGTHPHRQSYFQPVIEKLDYVVPDLIGKSPFLILEGISDYFAFTLAKRKASNLEGLSLMPSGGATSIGALISLLLGRAENFFVLLDDDKEGKEAAERYRSDWGLNIKQVATIGEIFSEHKGKELENLLTKNTEDIIKEHLKITAKPNKKQIKICLAEAVAQSDDNKILDEDTTQNLRTLMLRIQGFLT